MNNISIQQSFIVEFTVLYHMCPDCHKSFTPHTWGATVQVRQKVEHKRTFFMLEQLILKHNLHTKILKIKEVPDGLDFYFKSEAHTRKLVNFLAVIKKKILFNILVNVPYQAQAIQAIDFSR